MAAAPALAGHCQNPPVIDLRKPSAKVSIQKACYLDFGNYCSIDTFYQDTLRNELVRKMQANLHAIMGYVDSIQNHMVVDTYLVNGSYPFYDTTRREDIWMTVHSQIKGVIPEQKLFFSSSKLTYWPENPLYFTYAGLIDTPFVAIFDTYGSLDEMHIGYEDGCFVEPSAYLIINGAVEKKGQEGIRMPGVSVPIAEWATAAGLDSRTLSVPSVRPHNTRIRFNGSTLTLSRGPTPQNFYLYDVNGSHMTYSRKLGKVDLTLFDLSGKRMARSHIGDAVGNYSVANQNFSAGMYLLKISGDGWSRGKPLFLPDRLGIVDTAHIGR